MEQTVFHHCGWSSGVLKRVLGENDGGQKCCKHNEVGDGISWYCTQL